MFNVLLTHQFYSFDFRARPPKYISKLIITFIWVISILFSIPMALALRVIQMPFRKYSLHRVEMVVFMRTEYFFFVTENGDLSGTYPFCDVVNFADNFATYRYYLSFVQVITHFIRTGVHFMNQNIWRISGT